MIRSIYITMIAEPLPSWCLRPEILSGIVKLMAVFTVMCTEGQVYS